MNLENELAKQLIEFLKKNLDVFSWTHIDVVGIHPNVMCHRLNINPQAKPICQKRGVLDANHYQALQEEVDRLLKIGFITESFYPD